MMRDLDVSGGVAESGACKHDTTKGVVFDTKCGRGPVIGQMQ